MLVHCWYTVCQALLSSASSGQTANSDKSSLVVQRNGLIGQLPDELGKLSKLQIVRLGFNKLALLLPRAWSGMKNLRFMDLRSNSLTGTLPLVSLWLFVLIPSHSQMFGIFDCQHHLLQAYHCICNAAMQVSY